MIFLSFIILAALVLFLSYIFFKIVEFIEMTLGVEFNSIYVVFFYIIIIPATLAQLLFWVVEYSN